MLFGEGITGLATGILIGGLLQLAVQIPILYKKGFRLKLGAGLRHPEIKNISKLMLPRIFSSSIYQLNNLIDTVFGSLAYIVGEGAVAILYFAYRLVLLPIGIFSTALSQVILPTLSRESLEENYEKLKQTVCFSLKLTFFVLIPASLGLMFLAKPIITALFQGGRFDAYSTEMTAQALFFYSIGLFAYGSTKILQSAFFALKDTATPTKAAFASMILNVLLILILMFPLKLGGLALATSLSGIFNFSILLYILNKKTGGLKLGSIFWSLAKILVCAVSMGVISYLISKKLIYSGDIMQRLINLAMPILCAIFSYLLFCSILRIEQVNEIKKWLRVLFKK